jgi:cysteinyl-tRNA synthetase
MANYWMHNGFLQVEGEKMSKSLGNFFTIRDLLEKWPGDVLRLQMLLTHYRQPIDWTESQTNAAREELATWSTYVSRSYNLPNKKIASTVIDALAEDMNTPAAVSALRELFSKAKRGSFEDVMEFIAGCHFLGFRKLNQPGVFDFGVTGLNVGQHNIRQHEKNIERLRASIANDAPASVQQTILSSIKSDEIDVRIDDKAHITLIKGNATELEARIAQLLEARTNARKSKNFKESDRIRDELAAMGVVLKDSKNGTTWEIAR